MAQEKGAPISDDWQVAAARAARMRHTSYICPLSKELKPRSR
ncbi:hypothetical protein C7S15_0415 [Burkholderia cepacia]|nr:hypothetical protein [Burkholderia cepacia]